MNDSYEIDITSPILPGVGIGVFKLRSHITDYFDIIKYYTVDKLDLYRHDHQKYAFLQTPFQVVYYIANCLYVSFHTMNGRLMKITAVNGYKGYFNNKTYVGMPLSKFTGLEPQFYYDPTGEEEWYINPQIKEIAITHDPYFKFVESISVYVEEMYDDNFERIGKFDRGTW